MRTVFDLEVNKLLQLILVDMQAATNRDLAADGPVGNEEQGVWAKIEAQAQRVRETHGNRTIGDGAERIATERQRQMVIGGYTHQHDDDHSHGELVDAAVAYAEYTPATALEATQRWPFAGGFKPDYDDPVPNLVRAGALIAAEIDRCIRNRFRR